MIHINRNGYSRVRESKEEFVGIEENVCSEKRIHLLRKLINSCFLLGYKIKIKKNQ